MNNQNLKNEWNANLYDEKISFVSILGKDVVTLLDPKEGEDILDLGCGTGDLANKISELGANVEGVDASPTMIEIAKSKYPKLKFHIDDATSFQTNKKYDAVFSNAAIHWMKEPSKVVEVISNVLKSGGRFVAEFGGEGNIKHIVDGINFAFEKRNISIEDRNPWYFPSIAEYSTILEKEGFEVKFAYLFDRPTIFEDGKHGLDQWLDMFGSSYFKGISKNERVEIYRDINVYAEPFLFNNKDWIGDYRRLRIIAIKR